MDAPPDGPPGDLLRAGGQAGGHRHDGADPVGEHHGPLQDLHAAHRAAHHAQPASHTEVVGQAGLHPDHVTDRHHREPAAVGPAIVGVGRRRPGGALTATQHVGADHEEALGVHRLPRAHHAVPPAGRGMAMAGGPVHVAVAGPGVAHQHGVRRPRRSARPTSRRRPPPPKRWPPPSRAKGRPGVMVRNCRCPGSWWGCHAPVTGVRTGAGRRAGSRGDGRRPSVVVVHALTSSPSIRSWCAARAAEASLPASRPHPRRGGLAPWGSRPRLPDCRGTGPWQPLVMREAALYRAPPSARSPESLLSPGPPPPRPRPDPAPARPRPRPGAAPLSASAPAGITGCTRRQPASHPAPDRRLGCTTRHPSASAPAGITGCTRRQPASHPAPDRRLGCTTRHPPVRTRRWGGPRDGGTGGSQRRVHFRSWVGRPHTGS
jgi:hypothetical protein